MLSGTTARKQFCSEAGTVLQEASGWIWPLYMHPWGMTCSEDRSDAYMGLNTVVMKQKVRVKFMMRTVIFAGLCAAAIITQAATITWDGEGGDANWSTAANWSTDTVPSSSDGVKFAGTSPTTVNNDLVGAAFGAAIWNAIDIDSTSAYTLNGNRVTLMRDTGNSSSRGYLQMAGAGHTINFDIAINNTYWSVTGTGSAQQINGAISETGAAGMTRLKASGDGTGTLILNGSNTFVADVLVSGCAFELGGSGLLQFEIGESGTNNKVYGDGGTYTDSAEFRGSFVFDLSGAGTTVGDSWTVVDDSDLTVSYGSSFSVDGFRDVGNGRWNKYANGVTYQFDEATGDLSVIFAGMKNIRLISITN
ncbi:MAG: hypothetical protein AB7E95_11860 [Kiritimatiellales bacterium]